MGKRVVNTGINQCFLASVLQHTVLRHVCFKCAASFKIQMCFLIFKYANIVEISSEHLIGNLCMCFVKLVTLILKIV